MQTVRVQGPGFTRLISRQSGAGSILVTNTSLTVTVFLTDKDVGNPATADSVTLGPNASKTFDGSGDVYGFVTGGSADVEVIEGGVATFLGLTQASGALVLPSIRSDNFLHTVSGWSINNDGTAEFNSVTIRGSTIVGSVSLWYDGPNPATANLIASVASTAGNDGFGHNYLQGIWAYDNTGSGTTIGIVPGTRAELDLGSGNASESRKSRFITSLSGSGGNTQIVTSMQSAHVTSQPNANDGSSIAVISGTTDGVTAGPVIQLATISNNVTTSGMSMGDSGIITVGNGFFSNIGSASSPSVISTDNFQSLGSPGIANVTVNAARYAIVPSGVGGVPMCHIDVALTATGAVAAGVYTFANTLAAAYRFPGNYSRSYEVGFNGSITTATNNSDLLVDGAGTASPGRVRLQIPALPVGTSMTVTCLIPLN